MAQALECISLFFWEPLMGQDTGSGDKVQLRVKAKVPGYCFPTGRVLLAAHFFYRHDVPNGTRTQIRPKIGVNAGA